MERRRCACVRECGDEVLEGECDVCQYVDTCMCKDNYVMINNECVPPSDCTCQYNGKIYAVSSPSFFSTSVLTCDN